MPDLQSKSMIIAKGWMFLLAGVLAGGLLLYENRSTRNAIILMICVWCFCRFYYFAFYVIEHYVDGDYKYSGLYDFIRYSLRNRQL